MHLDDIALYVRIVELGTLSAAARERNVPVSQVTRALARLESQCGARLLHRSTHGLSLTDEGDTVLAHARRLVDVEAELASALSGKRATNSTKRLICPICLTIARLRNASQAAAAAYWPACNARSMASSGCSCCHSHSAAFNRKALISAGLQVCCARLSK